MLKAILWDNDGVLVDTEGLYFQACRETLERLGVRLSEARFIELFLKASEGLTRIAAEHRIDEQALEPARIWRNARYTELLRAGVPVIDGARQVLRQLHGTVRMGIVTSSRREHFEIIHAATRPAGLHRFHARARRLPAFQARPRALPHGHAAKRP